MNPIATAFLTGGAMGAGFCVVFKAFAMIGDLVEGLLERAGCDHKIGTPIVSICRDCGMVKNDVGNWRTQEEVRNMAQGAG